MAIGAALGIGSRSPVIYVSGYTHDVIASHVVLEAGVAFLPKPFTPSVLLAQVRATLDRAPGPALRS